MRINKTTLTMVQLLTMLLFQTTTTASEILKAETLWLTGILLSHSLSPLSPLSLTGLTSAWIPLPFSTPPQGLSAILTLVKNSFEQYLPPKSLTVLSVFVEYPSLSLKDGPSYPSLVDSSVATFTGFVVSFQPTILSFSLTWMSGSECRVQIYPLLGTAKFKYGLYLMVLRGLLKN